ncbi:MAG: hypothetical protein QGH25_23860, partial [Candidatus Latescibacteria bacterium]|nr:hypothetical protein [Candidatus Latescibacterota bacterium]
MGIVVLGHAFNPSLHIRLRIFQADIAVVISLFGADDDHLLAPGPGQFKVTIRICYCAYRRGLQGHQ